MAVTTRRRRSPCPNEQAEPAEAITPAEVQRHHLGLGGEALGRRCPARPAGARVSSAATSRRPPSARAAAASRSSGLVLGHRAGRAGPRRRRRRSRRCQTGSRCRRGRPLLVAAAVDAAAGSAARSPTARRHACGPPILWAERLRVVGAQGRRGRWRSCRPPGRRRRAAAAAARAPGPRPRRPAG